MGHKESNKQTNKYNNKINQTKYLQMHVIVKYIYILGTLVSLPCHNVEKYQAKNPKMHVV